jgi:cellulase
VTQQQTEVDQWGSSHSGPVMNYLADCGGNFSTSKGDNGTPWVKFDQMAYDTTKSPPWGSDFLAKQGAAWTVTIPNLKPGEYSLRHEILGLHVAGTRMGAQFYPACVQIKIGGSGTKSLRTGVGLPGAYIPDDTNGVLVQLWRVNQGQVTYTAPGGPVITI